MCLKLNSFYPVAWIKQTKNCLLYILCSPCVCISRDLQRETNSLMLFVAIGCNSPFTTVNLLCANTTECMYVCMCVCLCVCVHVMISWPVFSLKTDQSSFCKLGLSSSWPLLFFQLYLSKDLRLLLLFLFWVSVCYTSGGQRWDGLSLSHSMAFPAPFENCFDDRGL